MEGPAVNLAKLEGRLPVSIRAGSVLAQTRAQALHLVLKAFLQV